MRTTLTLDPDIAAKLKEQCRVTGLAFKTVVNQTLRSGLNAKRASTPTGLFRVQARPLRQKQGVAVDNIGELLEQLEGPTHR
ncbi:MAG: hypothetical protein A2289_05260 [Deltaproteobacteria bacterium RIFOXYA12_FULL_58_15]|nr:MAG: hypothetical protein A2289_05260 [Deltaproteobacteria bacterium RIFOXYA12_FULL_58_15]OGR13101.1 MAG: hypothetical protein A2341_08475 [Deltaproteobacteria bacterium RIFOXYB12_FULL_58_9]